MTESVAWTLLDTHTPVDPLGRYPTRERAIAAVKAWAWLHPDQADRYTVCALIPDGLTTDEVMAVAKDYLNRPPVLRAGSDLKMFPPGMYLSSDERAAMALEDGA